MYSPLRGLSGDRILNHQLLFTYLHEGQKLDVVFKRKDIFGQSDVHDSLVLVGLRVAKRVPVGRGGRVDSGSAAVGGGAAARGSRQRVGGEARGQQRGDARGRQQQRRPARDHHGRRLAERRARFSHDGQRLARLGHPTNI